MATFITRVELLAKASEKDYEALHAEMAKGGFKRTVKGTSGKTYKLPPAEYYYEGEGTATTVTEKAKKIADRIDPKSRTLTSGQDVAWTGLEASI